ncbi:MAG: DUF488 domain-containing protein [Hormoscilla sp. GM7CHS1pb]|nr:DUF488 domain-containing protein [Hormoscilla sp. GM7CHS1pb]
MTDAINLYTIGFTKKTAREFFESLSKSGVKRLLDTRLNNVSQLAGFAKRKDLEYFLKTICQIEYQHAIDLAPTKEMLEEYKKKGGDWETYEQRFLELIESRQIEDKISPEIVESSCLLCSEAQPHHCHRRLVAEYLQEKWGNVNICHL